MTVPVHPMSEPNELEAWRNPVQPGHRPPFRASNPRPPVEGEVRMGQRFAVFQGWMRQADAPVSHEERHLSHSPGPTCLPG